MSAPVEKQGVNEYVNHGRAEVLVLNNNFIKLNLCVARYVPLSYHPKIEKKKYENVFKIFDV